MPGDLYFTNEKYMLAVKAMALGGGALRDRLSDAYQSQAVRAHPPTGGGGPEMSDVLATRIRSLHERLTARAEPGIQGSVKATIGYMSEAEVLAAAEELVAIQDAVLYELRSHDRAEG